MYFNINILFNVNIVFLRKNEEKNHKKIIQKYYKNKKTYK